MKMEVSCGRWIFTGKIPMELARKSWGDRYAAVQAAEKAGYVVMANGNCVEDTRSTDGMGGSHGLISECLQEDHLTTREEEGA